VGLLDLNAEFDAPVTSAFFIGPPFGIGTDLAQTGENGPAVYPVTSLGIRLAGKAGEAVTWRAAAFDGVPGRVDSNSFQSVNVSGKQGALLIGELEIGVAGFNKLAVGAWSYTAAFTRIDADASGDHASLKGNRGAYAMLDRQLHRSDTLNLDGMLRVGVADGRFNAVDTYVGAAVVAGSFIAGRPDDAVGLAVAHGRTGRSFKRALAFDGGQPRRSETAVELTYRAPLQRWLAIVPGMQWIVSPGADRNLRNAWVVGARLEMSFGHSWPLLARQSRAASTESLANVIP
jgi:porin